MAMASSLYALSFLRSLHPNFKPSHNNLPLPLRNWTSFPRPTLPRSFSQGAAGVRWECSVQHSLLKGLAERAVAFPVKGEEVEVLSTPTDFFQTLKQGIRDAQERVIIASLYVGTGEPEQELLDVLADSLRNKPSLNALLLFDALRSTRITHSHDGCPFNSSADMLSRLFFADCAKWKSSANNYHDRLRIALYRTPDLTRILEKMLPTRMNEVVGVCHIKAYIFDNLVVMSGANLSTSYFTNRQDRYMAFRNCRYLADYLCNIVETVTCFSYLLGTEGELLPNPAIVDPRHDPAGFRIEMTKAVQDLVFPKSFQLDSSVLGGTLHHGLWLGGHCANTWVLPTIQMGPLGIKQDELCTLWLLENLPACSWLHFASAYFNLTPEFEAALLQVSLSKTLNILTASPQANGFYGSPGISGLIPKVYSVLEQSLYERAQQILREHPSDSTKDTVQKSPGGLRIFEYKRQNWTFHAKGVWCSLPGDNMLPSITLIGSSNFGYRSRQRDLEAQLFLVTIQPGLRGSLQQECDALFSHSRQVDEQVFLETGRSGGSMASFAAHLVRSWL